MHLKTGTEEEDWPREGLTFEEENWAWMLD
jgi:hypothetical protein